MKKTPQLSPEGFAFAILGIPCAALAVFLFHRPGDIYLNPDYLQILHIYRTLRMALADLELPLWSPYVGGGYPIVAHPYYFFGGMPWTVLPLIVGENIGAKLNLLAMMIMGAFGMYYFCRAILKENKIFAIWAALVFTCHPYITELLHSGNYADLTTLAFPLTLAMFWKGKDDKRYLIPCVLLLGMSLNFGMHYPPVVLYLFIMSLPLILTKDNEYTFKSFGRLFTLAVGMNLLFYAVHLLPFLELYQKSNRIISDYRVVKGFSSIFYPGKIFLLPYLLAIGALVSARKKCVYWLIPLFISHIILVPHFKWLPLFYLVQKLSLLANIQEPVHYFFFFFSMSVAVLSAFAIKYLWRRGKTAVLLIAALTFLPFLYHNGKNFQAISLTSAAAPAIKKEKTFFQIYGLGMYRWDLRTIQSNQYFNLLANIGTIDWYGNLILPENAVPKFFIKYYEDEKFARPFDRNYVWYNKLYRGEIYGVPRENISDLKVLRFGWQKLELLVHTNARAMIVINQNFHSGWRCFNKHVDLFNHSGLIGLNCREPLHAEITLYFLPTSFLIGLVVSLMTVCFAAPYFIFSRRGRSN